MSEEAYAGDLLRMEGIGHRYGAREVLRSVSLSVRPGECVALTGPNGCGKSTLLRLASGREKPVSGHVLFDGEAVDEDSALTRARIATVLDPASYYPDLTVREHLMFVAVAHGLRGAAEREVEGALRSHRLDGHADALPDSLSSGQKQLMLLAAAFLRPHDLLLLDEPEQRLDSCARRELADRLVRQRRRNVAVLLATHDQRLASRVADRVITLESGEPREPVAAGSDPTEAEGAL